MLEIKTKIILAESLMIIVLLWLLFGSSKADNHGSVIQPEGEIPKVTVTVNAPLTGLNKQEARKAGIISKDIANDPDKAVLASGHIKDETGSKDISAVIDTKTGETQIVQKRPFAEFMKIFEVGLGYGFESGDQAKVVQLRATIGRMDRVYFTGQAEFFDVDRVENKHPWNTIALINFRF